MYQKVRLVTRMVLKPIGIWSILSILRRMIRIILIRINAAKFTPLSRKMLVRDYYISKSRKKTKSQFGQDIFIFERIFNCRKTGFFVEVGGNDPIVMSNTFFFEIEGWEGISFEPIESICALWESTRRAKCYPYAIGSSETWIEFDEVSDSGSDGVLSSVKGFGRLAEHRPTITVKKQMRRLENIFNELDIEHIDILFIDVEGYELNVLKGINFDKVSIKCICAETLAFFEYIPFSKKSDEIRTFLRDKGYILVANIGGDDIFVYKG